MPAQMPAQMPAPLAPETPSVVQPSIVAPNRLPGIPADGQQGTASAQDIANALSEALKQNGMKVEITMVDGKTGQRKTFTGNGNGAKVSTAMTFPR